MSAGFIIRLLSRTLLVAGLAFAVWAVCRLWYLAVKSKKGDKAPSLLFETLLWVFVFYILCLYQITVFRYGLHLEAWVNGLPPFDRVNLVPLVHTLKLLKASSKWVFIYNLLGNILWFVPFGMLYPITLGRKRGFVTTVLTGAACSMSIELLQLLFVTGITDIDDVIFNTLGVALGYLLMLPVRYVYKKNNA